MRKLLKAIRRNLIKKLAGDYYYVIYKEDLTHLSYRMRVRKYFIDVGSRGKAVEILKREMLHRLVDKIGEDSQFNKADIDGETVEVECNVTIYIPGKVEN